MTLAISPLAIIVYICARLSWSRPPACSTLEEEPVVHLGPPTVRPHPYGLSPSLTERVHTLYLSAMGAPKSGWSFDWDERDLVLISRLDGYPGWRISASAAATPQGLVLSRLVVEAEGEVPAAGITSRLLHELSAPEMLTAYRSAAREAEATVGVSPSALDHSSVGRRGRSDYYYAVWALAYTYSQEGPDGPVPAAETLARANNLSVSRVRSILGEARKRGLLSQAPVGRQGGEMTEKASRILDERIRQDAEAKGEPQDG